MSDPNPSADAKTAREVRDRTMDLLGRLTAAASEYDLPRPPEALETYRRKLQENRYTVLVAGEAKRGKSTFVNALLGRDLLPTDVDIATCQVFCIRQAAAEGYQVRFEDGSAQEIAAADLPRYGSQVLADLGEGFPLGQLIRWIEVEGPVHFLPQEITLLDSPGLGSLYAAHARVTQRYVPVADAVIFVLSSESPIGREEVRFLEKILGVTRSVLFIQTMIDRYNREHWQAIRARNEQILTETFGDRLPNHRVWPISSTNLLKAAQSGDMDFEEVSKYRPLAAALQAFLFHVAGWGRAAEAVVLALDYQRAGAELLKTRLDDLRKRSDQERKKRQEEVDARGREYERKWGPQGQERGKLLDGVREITRRAKQRFQQAVALNGEIHRRHSERIEAVRDLGAAQALAATLADDVANDVGKTWDDVWLVVQAEVAKRLARFVAETQVTIAVPRPQDPQGRPPSVDVRPPGVQGDLYAKVQSGLKEGRWAMGTFAAGASLAGAIVVGTVVSLPVFLPVAVIGTLGAGLFGMLRGVNVAKTKEVLDAKRDLETHLRNVMQALYQHFFNVNVIEDKLVVHVDEYFNELVAKVTAYVESAAAEKLREAQAERDRLAEDARLDEQQRKERIDSLSRQASTWSQLRTELLALTDKLNRSNQPGL